MDVARFFYRAERPTTRHITSIQFATRLFKKTGPASKRMFATEHSHVLLDPLCSA